MGKVHHPTYQSEICFRAHLTRSSQNPPKYRNWLSFPSFSDIWGNFHFSPILGETQEIHPRWGARTSLTTSTGTKCNNPSIICVHHNYYWARWNQSKDDQWEEWICQIGKYLFDKFWAKRGGMFLVNWQTDQNFSHFLWHLNHKSFIKELLFNKCSKFSCGIFPIPWYCKQ